MLQDNSKTVGRLTEACDDNPHDLMPGTITTPLDTNLERVDTDTVYGRYLLQRRQEPVSVHADALVCGDGYVCLELTAVRFATRAETRKAYEELIKEVDEDDRLVCFPDRVSYATILDMRLPSPAVCVIHPDAFTEEEVMQCYELRVDLTTSIGCQVAWERPSTPW